MTRGQRTLANIKKYDLKSAIFNFAASWKDVKISTLASSWKKLPLYTELEPNFEGFKVMDFHQILHLGGEKNITMENVETWLEENGGDPGYRMLLAEEITDAARAVDKEDGDTESSDEEESCVKMPTIKLSFVQESVDNFLTNIDTTSCPQMHLYYEHFRTSRELIIRKQYNTGKQLKLDSSFKSVTCAPPAFQPSQTE
ncbi:Tigger transposable element-derived protein 7-like 55 [Homarus americanus]|uniref:Tigger transposable element-derived protein 7-like 55 n=1 Tax=Homarus americanus TaxID=6706 RepID=A0A8J5N3U2_HOMAM|nr:Tigger transposable element-derived protein 7-like 55 [Homarus americanus]